MAASKYIRSKRKKEVDEDIEKFKAEEKVKEEKRNKALEYLESHKEGKIVTYNSMVADMLRLRLKSSVYWRGWTFEVMPTDKGVVLEIYSPNGRMFRDAFKTTGISKYDLNAIDTFAIMAESTIDKNEQRPKG
jgi:hypothetical protein